MTAYVSLRRRLGNRPHVPAAALAAAAAATTGLVAVLADLPLRDPDGIAGPAFLRLPAIMLLLFALDVVPRGIARGRRSGGLRAGVAGVLRERWPPRRVALVVVGLVSFYLTYVAYRNLKSFLPFLRPGTADAALLDVEPGLLLGEEAGPLLHALLGTGAAAHVLSTVYVAFLLFVPLSLGAALVWSRDLALGFWYVTTLGINWVAGVISYYVLPSLGPVFARPELFSALPSTGTSRLQESLLEARIEVLADPHRSEQIHGIAAFASLHVAIVFSAALIAQLVGLRPAVRRALWGFLFLTVMATMYFGWHYAVDDLAGLVIGAFAVWLGALATGQDVRGGLRRLTGGSHGETPAPRGRLPARELG